MQPGQIDYYVFGQEGRGLVFRPTNRCPARGLSSPSDGGSILRAGTEWPRISIRCALWTIKALAPRCWFANYLFRPRQTLARNTADKHAIANAATENTHSGCGSVKPLMAVMAKPPVHAASVIICRSARDSFVLAEVSFWGLFMRLAPTYRQKELGSTARVEGQKQSLPGPKMP